MNDLFICDSKDVHCPKGCGHDEAHTPSGPYGAVCDKGKLHCTHTNRGCTCVPVDDHEAAAKWSNCDGLGGCGAKLSMQQLALTHPHFIADAIQRGDGNTKKTMESAINNHIAKQELAGASSSSPSEGAEDVPAGGTDGPAPSSLSIHSFKPDPACVPDDRREQVDARLRNFAERLLEIENSKVIPMPTLNALSSEFSKIVEYASPLTEVTN